jgi:hypothetical protein
MESGGTRSKEQVFRLQSRGVLLCAADSVAPVFDDSYYIFIIQKIDYGYHGHYFQFTLQIID